MTAVGDAPSMAIPPGQTPVAHPRLSVLQRVAERLEAWLERERDQLALWVPVGLGAGIAGWFALPDAGGWTGLIVAALAVACLGGWCGRRRRLGRVLLVGGIGVALGCANAWLRAERVAAPVLDGPRVASFTAMVERVQILAADDALRVVLTGPDDPALPPRIRVKLPLAVAPAQLAPGDRLRMRARLVPPAPPTLPGGYDFARAAWFQQLGGTGRVLGRVERIGAVHRPGSRERLSAHIRDALPVREGGFAVALVTGDQGGVTPDDADALRRAGLAHLLSVSGLHLTAVVGAAMLLTVALLALVPPLALAVRVPLVAAAVGAAAGIFYTWLSGAEVPTIRACIATLLVLAGLALGRDALTLRLVATGATVVLLLWPESLVGASFQLSFAAVTAIVALYDHPAMRAFMAPRDEAGPIRLARWLAGLLVSGIAVEVALAPIALFHFHAQGVLGAVANLVAIPLTTFVVMPLEASALLADTIGAGTPVWWLAGEAIRGLLGIAHRVASVPGAVVMIPQMPVGAFALLTLGGLMMCLLTTRVRWLGIVPVLAGCGWTLATPAPDVLVTGDGLHLALRTARGDYALVRPRAGDYVRRVLGEAAGTESLLDDLDTAPDARCSADSCTARIVRGGRGYRLLATRSAERLPGPVLEAACRAADIVVSSRALPRCQPRLLKLDRPALARTGGIALHLADPIGVRTVAEGRGHHPWVDPPRPARASQRTQ